jgi:hypothetical protein
MDRHVGIQVQTLDKTRYQVLLCATGQCDRFEAIEPAAARVERRTEEGTGFIITNAGTVEP